MSDSHTLPMQRTPTGWYRADNARVLGQPLIGTDTSVWFGCVIRCDVAPIVIGERTNIQDGTVIHADTGVPNEIGDEVTVGHRALLHGASIGNRALIGMGAILLGRCTIGEEAVIAAGAVVKEGFVVPARTVVAGVPGKVVREVTDDEADRLRLSALRYLGLARLWSEHTNVTPEMVAALDTETGHAPFRSGR